MYNINNVEHSALQTEIQFFLISYENRAHCYVVCVPVSVFRVFHHGAEDCDRWRASV